MAETKIVRKWWWVWDFEREEQWLNDMAMEGWALDGVGFVTFRFVRCEPGEYIVRLAMRNSQEGYKDFMKELDAEYIGSFADWSFHRRKASYGVFEMYSDIDSRISHLDRIAKMLTIIGAANILIGVANTFNVSRLGILNLLCGCLLMYALGRIRGKEDELKNQRALHE